MNDFVPLPPTNRGFQSVFSSNGVGFYSGPASMAAAGVTHTTSKPVRNNDAEVPQSNTTTTTSSFVLLPPDNNLLGKFLSEKPPVLHIPPRARRSFTMAPESSSNNSNNLYAASSAAAAAVSLLPTTPVTPVTLVRSSSSNFGLGLNVPPPLASAPVSNHHQHSAPTSLLTSPSPSAPRAPSNQSRAQRERIQPAKSIPASGEAEFGPLHLPSSTHFFPQDLTQ